MCDVQKQFFFNKRFGKIDFKKLDVYTKIQNN